MKLVLKIKEFISSQVWEENIDDSPFFKKQSIILLRQLIVATRGFKEDEVLLRSSALTFYTLISIVPIVAMAFGIAKGFGFEEKLNEQIRNYFSSQPEVSAQLINFSHSMLENTKGGLVAGFGFAILIYSVMKVLSSIELSFNAVWGIKEARNLIRKFTEYTAIMLIAPLLVVLSSGLTIWITSAASTMEKVSVFEFASPAIKFLIQLTPYILNWLLFAFLYIVIPNTKVKFKYALVAGVIAGTGFNLLEWAYFSFQIGAVRYNAVYGSFAALPLFLIWVQTSWVIVLFGGEIAFAGQNLHKFVYREKLNNQGVNDQNALYLLLCCAVQRHFKAETCPVYAKTIADELNIPIPIIRNAAIQLVSKGILINRINDSEDQISLLPKIDFSTTSISQLINRLLKNGTQIKNLKSVPEYEQTQSLIDDLMMLLEEHPNNCSIEELSKKLISRPSN